MPPAGPDQIGSEWRTSLFRARGVAPAGASDKSAFCLPSARTAAARTGALPAGGARIEALDAVVTWRN